MPWADGKWKGPKAQKADKGQKAAASLLAETLTSLMTTTKGKGKGKGKSKGHTPAPLKQGERSSRRASGCAATTYASMRSSAYPIKQARKDATTTNVAC